HHVCQVVNQISEQASLLEADRNVSANLRVRAAFRQGTLEQLQRAAQASQRRPQLVAGQRDKLFLELAHTAITNVADDNHSSFSLAFALNGLTGGLEPTTGAVRTRDREMLSESLTARCSLPGIHFRRNEVPRAVVEG